MTDRWRKPVIPAAIETDVAHVLIEDGVQYENHHVTLTETDTERIRQGYVCMQCFEPHEVPFPERCICGFPMRDVQPQRFAAEFEGNVRLGPRMSIQDEIAEMELEAERRNWRKGSSIWLPGTAT